MKRAKRRKLEGLLVKSPAADSMRVLLALAWTGQN